MMMNRKGQLFMLGFMLAVMAFFAVIVMIEPVKDGITWAREPDRLDCANSSITTGNQMTCIIVDAYLPIYIGVGLAIAIAFMGIKEFKERTLE